MALHPHHDGINVHIQAGDDASSKVECFGSSVEIIGDKDIQTFGLTDADLKNAVHRYCGGWPDDVYLKSPTPWNDLYKTYGWRQVQITLRPTSSRILGIRNEPVILTTSDFVNDSSVKGKYNAVVTQQVQETISNSWSKGEEISVQQEINYSVGTPGVGSVGGATRFGYSCSWGQNTSKTTSITVGSSQGVEVELEPGQVVVASLHATRGSMEVQVDYSASLAGDVACNYSKTFEGHHFWKYDLNAVQGASDMRRTVESTEVIKIGFYSHARLVITDKKTQEKIASFDIDI